MNLEKKCSENIGNQSGRREKREIKICIRERERKQEREKKVIIEYPLYIYTYIYICMYMYNSKNLITLFSGHLSAKKL